MKHQILLLAITAATLSSCTSAYKTGQTPDDIYFSPARPQDEYVRVNKNEDRYNYSDQYYDDRYLRMKVRNYATWNYLNDWYSYDRYGYRYNYYYGTYFNPYTSWNYYYNPYFTNTVVVYNPKITSSLNNTVKPRNFSLNAYTNNNYSNVNANMSKGIYRTNVINRPVYNNSNNGFSNTLKQIFSSGNNNNNYYNNSYNSSSRTYSPASSGSSGGSGNSGGSSGSSGGGGVSRPNRGGGN